MEPIRIEQQGPLQVWRLDKARGNAIDESLDDGLLWACDAATRDSSVSGVLFASAHPKLFCPGFDLASLATFDRPQMTRFITRFAEMVRSLCGFPKPMVAAISGHAVAGGAILALTADYRVLRSGGVQFGLNEVKVGVPLPAPFIALLKASVAPPAFARVALLGSNFADDEAVAVGLCHEVAPPEEFEEHCLDRLGDFVDRHAGAFAATKAELRREMLTAMTSNGDAALATFVDTWFSDETRARVRAILESLERRAGT